MIEINKVWVKKWGKLQGRDQFAPFHIDINCPNNSCKRSLVNSRLGWEGQTSYAFCQARCASCGEYLRFFLVDPPKNEHPDSIEPSRLLMVPPQEIDIDIAKEVRDLSPAYVAIYTQAAKAEMLGLTELNGVGYRKALEFLIKDYLCYLHPEECHTIKQKFLGACIRDYVSDPRLKECADRTAWLGNDAAHYERRWNDRDIEDLKLLLQLTSYWILSELLTQKFTDQMSRT